MQRLLFIVTTILLLACLMISCFFKRKTKENKTHSRITVTGHTKNMAGQAVVVTENTDVYYVEGMHEWDIEWLDHTVRITGDLAGKNGEVQPAEKKIIKAAVVMLMNTDPILNY